MLEWFSLPLCLFFFHKMIKFYKDICFTRISYTSAELFSHKLMLYVLYKYKINIFDLLKCTSMDFYIWALALYLEGEAQNAALEIPEDGIAEESVLTVFYTVHIDYLRILPSRSIKLWKHLKCLNIPVMSIQSFLNEF